jgi:hypothetical protein
MGTVDAFTVHDASLAWLIRNNVECEELRHALANDLPRGTWVAIYVSPTAYTPVEREWKLHRRFGMPSMFGAATGAVCVVCRLNHDDNDIESIPVIPPIQCAQASKMTQGRATTWKLCPATSSKLRHIIGRDTAPSVPSGNTNLGGCKYPNPSGPTPGVQKTQTNSPKAPLSQTTIKKMFAAL